MCLMRAVVVIDGAAGHCVAAAVDAVDVAAVDAGAADDIVVAVAAFFAIAVPVVVAGGGLSLFADAGDSHTVCANSTTRRRCNKGGDPFRTRTRSCRTRVAYACPVACGCQLLGRPRRCAGCVAYIGLFASYGCCCCC